MAHAWKIIATEDCCRCITQYTHTPNVGIHTRVGEYIGKYDTLLEVVKKLRWSCTCRESEGNFCTPFCRVKLRGNDHEEGQQDSGWTI